jgi:hypothetical protein
MICILLKKSTSSPVSSYDTLAAIEKKSETQRQNRAGEFLQRQQGKALRCWFRHLSHTVAAIQVSAGGWGRPRSEEGAAPHDAEVRLLIHATAEGRAGLGRLVDHHGQVFVG